ncbi:nucleoporin p58/p45 isoform X2 [Bacillus rossius redtenbacheri]|uniref:nucleoporin p58/p45 isoform X2 n=1 Tax=Bacillus rossius redtenbacheri TaxID=93214 RepID=UPI002FDD5DB2
MSGFSFGNTGLGTGSSFSFGSSQPVTTASTGGLFGTPTTAPTFGSGATPLFGSAATSQPSGGLALNAGQTPALTFGAPASTAASGLSFNAPQPTNFQFSAPTTTTGLSFGPPASTAPAGFAMPATGLTFGTPATSASGGIRFGTPAQATTATPTPGTLNLGAGSTGGGLFGAPAATSASGISLGFGTTQAAASTALSGLTFGSTTPATSGAALSFQGLGAGKPLGGSLFSTPTTSAGLSLGTASTTAGLGLGATSTAPRLSLGATSTAPGLGLGTTSTAPGLGLGTTTTAPGLGLGTTSTAPGLGLGTTSTAPGLGLGATSTAPALGLGTTSTSIGFGLGSTSTSGGFGLFGQTSKPAASVAALGTAPATTIASVGLGGVEAKSGLAGVGNQRQESKAVKENEIPVEIIQTIDAFKNFVKVQKGLSSEVARGSAQPLHKVEEDIEAMKKVLSSLGADLRRHTALADNLKYDTAKCLQNAEMAQRTQDMSPELQYNNTAPQQYFEELVSRFEDEVARFTVAIDEAEKHLHSLAQPRALSPDELTSAMQRIHHTFVFLAGRLQAVHNSVEMQKQQYLNLRKYFLKDATNVFDQQPLETSAGPQRPRSAAATLPGPSPFSGVGSQMGFGLMFSTASDTPSTLPSTNPLGK